MKVYGLLESASVKIQTLKTAIEVSAERRVTSGERETCWKRIGVEVLICQSATLLLRVDDIVSARRPEDGAGGGGVQTMGGEMGGDDGPGEVPEM
jgi:T-complex protein 1 subunit gamma